MPKCGSQIVLCDLPIRFDTYKFTDKMKEIGTGLSFLNGFGQKTTMSNVIKNKSYQDLMKATSKDKKFVDIFKGRK